MNNEDSRKKLIELIMDARTCMLTTTNKDGELVARPMGMQEAEFDGDLWFFTTSGSTKTTQIQANPKVGVTFSDQKNSSWVSISGEAMIVNDRQKAEELWSPLMNAWFPNGLETPELVLIKVEANGAEYWDSPSSRVVTLLSLAKSAITGEPDDPGDNQTVDLT